MNVFFANGSKRLMYYMMYCTHPKQSGRSLSRITLLHALKLRVVENRSEQCCAAHIVNCCQQC